MEAVLDLYQRRYDPARPVVCIDEKPVQLQADVREPIPPAPGRPRRTDHEYRRQGTANLFVVYEPLRGWRRIEATERPAKVDFAHLLKQVVDDDYPQADEVQVVCDNLNIHDLSALYEAFAPTEARRIARRVRLHKTPKHGSWLNMAEIELAALSAQCLSGRRIPDLEVLRRETSAWQAPRNNRGVPSGWRFTTDDARIRLRRLYPSVDD
jgi:hypothetical protein